MGWNNDQYPSNWNEIRKGILNRDGHECTRCGTSDDQLHVHHIEPVSEGGSHSPKNLKTLCHSCHEKVHGHRIPTKSGGSTNSSSLLKKAVWMPSWDVEGADDEIDDEIDFEDTFDFLYRENAQSRGDWIARQIGALVFFFVLISPGLWIAQDMILSGEGILISLVVTTIIYIIILLIPIISIPLALIGFLGGILAWFVIKNGLEIFVEIE